MATPEWPASLPQRPLQGSWSEDPYDPAIRQGAEVGPPMSRARANIEFNTQTASFILDAIEWQALNTFWRDTCSFGTTTFLMNDWADRVPAEYKFATVPKRTHIGDRTQQVGGVIALYRVTVSLIRMPGT